MDINLKEIINKIDKKELEDFLVDELESNTSLYNIFVSRFANYMPDEDKNSYSTRILYAIYDAYDDDGYINYGRTRIYMKEMYKFIEESTKLIKSKKYQQAFNLLSAILDSIPETNIDDSGGETGSVAYDCIENMNELLGHTLFDKINYKKLNDEILDYILSEINEGCLYNYGIELIELLDNYISEEYALNKIKDVLTKRIGKRRGYRDNDVNKYLDKIENKKHSD